MKYSHSRNLSSRSYAHVFVFMRFEWAEREMHAEMLSSSLCRLWGEQWVGKWGRATDMGAQ